MSSRSRAPRVFRLFEGELRGLDVDLAGRVGDMGDLRIVRLGVLRRSPCQVRIHAKIAAADSGEHVVLPGRQEKTARRHWMAVLAKGSRELGPSEPPSTRPESSRTAARRMDTRLADHGSDPPFDFEPEEPAGPVQPGFDRFGGHARAVPPCLRCSSLRSPARRPRCGNFGRSSMARSSRLPIWALSHRCSGSGSDVCWERMTCTAKSCFLTIVRSRSAALGASGRRFVEDDAREPGAESSLAPKGVEASNARR